MKIKYFFKIIKQVFLISPFRFLLYVLSFVIISLLPSFILISEKYFINSVNIEKNFDTLFLITLIYVIIYCVLNRLLFNISNLFYFGYNKKTENYFKTTIMYKLLKIDEINLLEAKKHDEFIFLYQNSYIFNGFLFPIIKFLFLFLLVKISYFIILVNYIGFWSILILFIYALDFYIRKFNVKKKSKNDEAFINDNRIKTYYEQLLKSKNSLKEIKTSNVSDELYNKWDDKYKIIASEYEKLDINNSMRYSFFEVIQKVFLGILYIIIFWQIYKFKYDLGTFKLLISTVIMLIQGQATFKNDLNLIFEYIDKSKLYYKKVYPMSKDEVQDMNVTYLDKNLNFNTLEVLSCEKIYFKYPNMEKYVLENVNFKIVKNQKIAIMGYNGSGKTTLSKIISGIFKPESGEVLFNNQRIKTNDLKYYLQFGNLFQEYIKYNVSLKENILFGCIKEKDNFAKFDELKSQLDLDSFFEKFSENENTLIGKDFYKNGIDLSGGQWQKLNFAKISFGDKSIFILDEPSASLDPLEEEKLLNFLEYFIKDKTVILLTHRFGFSRIADYIYVMSKGKIIEEGTHLELISNNMFYKEVYDKQREVFYNDKNIQK